MVFDFACRASEFAYQFGDIPDASLYGVAYIDRPRRIALRYSDHRIYRIVDVAQGARLRPVAVHGYGSSRERLCYERADHAPVTGQHAGAVTVEQANDARVNVACATVIGAKRFCKALAFVVARAYPYRVDATVVVLFLWRLFRIAVNLGRTCLYDCDAVRAVASKVEYVLHPLGVRPGGTHWIALVSFRARVASEVEDKIDRTDPGAESGIVHVADHVVNAVDASIGVCRPICHSLRSCLSLFLGEKMSNPTTLCPIAFNFLHRFHPMNPVAPVTKTFMTLYHNAWL